MTGDIDLVSDGELFVVKPYEPVPDVGSQFARHVQSDPIKNGRRSHTSKFRNLSAKDGDMVALCNLIQELYAMSEDLLYCLAGNRNVDRHTAGSCIWIEVKWTAGVRCETIDMRASGGPHKTEKSCG